jgi:hypothetical protein
VDPREIQPIFTEDDLDFLEEFEAVIGDPK